MTLVCLFARHSPHFRSFHLFFAPNLLTFWAAGRDLCIGWDSRCIGGPSGPIQWVHSPKIKLRSIFSHLFFILNLGLFPGKVLSDRWHPWFGWYQPKYSQVSSFLLNYFFVWQRALLFLSGYFGTILWQILNPIWIYCLFFEPVFPYGRISFYFWIWF